MKRLLILLIVSGVAAVLVLFQGPLSALFSLFVLYGCWKAAAGLRKGSRNTIAEGVVIALVGALLAAMVPVTYTFQSFAICAMCGKRQRQYGSGRVDGERAQPQASIEVDTTSWYAPAGMTPLPEWYREHFGTHCDHVWKLSYSRTDEYAYLLGIPFCCTTAYACGRGPLTPWLDEEALAALREKFAADPQACADYLRDACETFVGRRGGGELFSK